MIKDWGGKPDKKSINKKCLKLNKEMWKENQKIVKSIIMKRGFIIG